MHLYVYTYVRLYICMYIHRYVYTWVLYTVYYIYTYIGAPVEECIFVGCIKHPVTDVSVICSGESHLVFGLCNHSFPRHAQFFQYLAIYISLYRYRRPVNMFHLTKDDFLGDLPQISGAKMGQVSTSSPELNFLALALSGKQARRIRWNELFQIPSGWLKITGKSRWEVDQNLNRDNKLTDVF